MSRCVHALVLEIISIVRVSHPDVHEQQTVDHVSQIGGFCGEGLWVKCVNHPEKAPKTSPSTIVGAAR